MNKRLAQAFTGTLDPLDFGPIRADDGTVIYPDTSTFTLTDGDVIINTPAGSFVNDADTGITTYTWNASESSSLIAKLPRQNVRVRWTFLDGATTYERTQYIDIVAVKLLTDVHDADVVVNFPLLGQHRMRETSSVTSATTTSITDTATLSTFQPQAFLSSFVELITGSSEGAVVRVSLFDAVDATLSLQRALPFAPDAGDTYEIQHSYEPQVTRALRDIERYVREWAGDQASLKLLDGLDFTDVHLALSTQYACKILVATRDDEFAIAAEGFGVQYANALAELKVKFDGSGSSTGSDGSNVDVVTKPHYVLWGR